MSTITPINETVLNSIAAFSDTPKEEGFFDAVFNPFLTIEKLKLTRIELGNAYNQLAALNTRLADLEGRMLAIQCLLDSRKEAALGSATDSVLFNAIEEEVQFTNHG